jgi:tetratricopeptide (TPR) repeat protein
MFKSLIQTKKGQINNYFFTALILLFSSELLATAESDFKLGVESFITGDYAAAASYFESAMNQGMDSVSLQYNLASSYYKLGRYEESKKYFKLVNQTEAMRDLAEYNLGLIAIKEKDGTLARRYFSSIASTGKDKKLIKLSKKQLMALTPREDRWKAYLSSHLGYDDNISSVSGDSVLDVADTFYDVFATVDFLITGRRMNGWVADASLFGINYRETKTSDEEQYTLGIKRAILLQDWDTSARLNFSKRTYGGDDFQHITKLDLKGRKPISKSGRVYLRYQLEDIKSDNILYDYLEGWRQRARIEYRSYSVKNIKQIYYELELNDRGELVTSTFAYDYSPTRHSVRGIYTYISKRWWLTGDLNYRFSDYEASSTVDRTDNQWRLALSADYIFDRTFKFTTKVQYTDNMSSVDRYIYDKSVIKIGLSKLF